MLDLFCGRFGWGRAFAARGWEVVGIDLVEPPEIPMGCTFIKADVTQIRVSQNGRFSIFEHGDHGEELWSFRPDFVCASTPCEEFSKWGIRCFHPNPAHPELGIKLFNETRTACERSSIPYVMENVRAAQAFVGDSVHHCGPYYLWGSGVPALMPQGILKGARLGGGKIKADTPMELRREIRNTIPRESKRSMPDSEFTALIATIPPELANCVADYADRITSNSSQMAVAEALKAMERP